MGLKRFEVVLVKLDPTIGSEMQKTRPAVVVSPDEMNRNLNTVLVAPLTTQLHSYPSRIRCTFAGKTAEVALDQMRVMDRRRIIKKLGDLRPPTSLRVLATLREIFEP